MLAGMHREMKHQMLKTCLRALTNTDPIIFATLFWNCKMFCPVKILGTDPVLRILASKSQHHSSQLKLVVNNTWCQSFWNLCQTNSTTLQFFFPINLKKNKKHAKTTANMQGWLLLQQINNIKVHHYQQHNWIDAAHPIYYCIYAGTSFNTFTHTHTYSVLRLSFST